MSPIWRMPYWHHMKTLDNDNNNGDNKYDNDNNNKKYLITICWWYRKKRLRHFILLRSTTVRLILGNNWQLIPKSSCSDSLQFFFSSDTWYLRSHASGSSKVLSQFSSLLYTPIFFLQKRQWFGVLGYPGELPVFVFQSSDTG